MFFKILLQHFSGYVTVRVEGYFIEKFINKCIAQNIVVWNIKKERQRLAAAFLFVFNVRKSNSTNQAQSAGTKRRV